MKKRIKVKFVLLFILLFLTLAFYEANRLIEPVMIAQAKQEVQASLNKLVHNCMKGLKFDANELYTTQFNAEQEIISINYNSLELNRVLYDAMEIINESLLVAQSGGVDPITKQIYFDKGVVDEVALGYFSELAVLSNFGPKIKIRVRLIDRVSGNYEIYNEPYGINNTMLKITIRVKIKADVFAGISSEEIVMEEEIPIVLQLIQGNIPQYSPYPMK